jgi:hypothetical protein
MSPTGSGTGGGKAAATERLLRQISAGQVHATRQQMSTREKALAGCVARRTVFETAKARRSHCHRLAPSRVRYLTLPSALRQRTPSADVVREAASHRLPTGLAIARRQELPRTGARARPVSTVSSPTASWPYHADVPPIAPLLGPFMRGSTLIPDYYTNLCHSSHSDACRTAVLLLSKGVCTSRPDVGDPPPESISP